jgi:hypothetical protein
LVKGLIGAIVTTCAVHVSTSDRGLAVPNALLSDGHGAIEVEGEVGLKGTGGCRNYGFDKVCG